MSFGTVADLKCRIVDVLHKQGYVVNKDGRFKLRLDDREKRRDAHLLAKAERLRLREDFIRRFSPIAASALPNGSDIEVEKIDPILVEVKPDSAEEEFFRWWNLVWWSLPYERAYGRQIRYILFDAYHQAVIGLIGLQSPILSWNVRDEHLGISKVNRDVWVNQSLSAQRLGAVPPYNQILGGKLVALMMTSDEVKDRFARKYRDVLTVMNQRKLPAKLLFITTTGAYGKSSVYQRLKFDGQQVAEFIGFSQGSGSFHITNELFYNLITYLDKRGIDTRRGYGSGPSRKLRLIDTALQMLGFENGAAHGIVRSVYLFPLVENLKEVIQLGQRPVWIHRKPQDIVSFWKERWSLPRSQRDTRFREFKSQTFIESIEDELVRSWQVK